MGGAPLYSCGSCYRSFYIIVWGSKLRKEGDGSHYCHDKKKITNNEYRRWLMFFYELRHKNGDENIRIQEERLYTMYRRGGALEESLNN